MPGLNHAEFSNGAVNTGRGDIAADAPQATSLGAPRRRQWGGVPAPACLHSSAAPATVSLVPHAPIPSWPSHTLLQRFAAAEVASLMALFMAANHPATTREAAKAAAAQLERATANSFALLSPLSEASGRGSLTAALSPVAAASPAEAAACSYAYGAERLSALNPARAFTHHPGELAAAERFCCAAQRRMLAAALPAEVAAAVRVAVTVHCQLDTFIYSQPILFESETPAGSSGWGGLVPCGVQGARCLPAQLLSKHSNVVRCTSPRPLHTCVPLIPPAFAAGREWVVQAHAYLHSEYNDPGAGMLALTKPMSPDYFLKLKKGGVVALVRPPPTPTPTPTPAPTPTPTPTPPPRRCCCCSPAASAAPDKNASSAAACGVESASPHWQPALPCPALPRPTSPCPAGHGAEGHRRRGGGQRGRGAPRDVPPGAGGRTAAVPGFVPPARQAAAVCGRQASQPAGRGVGVLLHIGEWGVEEPGSMHGLVCSFLSCCC